MILRTFFYDRLAHASYLVGCAATGEAIVIDPNRDPQPYIEEAKANGLRIVAVTETHIHADYLSGTRELAAATGAKMYLSGEGGADWQYAFAQADSAVILRDGDQIKIGNLSLTAVHTPGHTPEHIAFLLVDHATSEIPHSMFTGDFIFVGDVGRPDLLERAAKVEGTMEQSARTLFHSLRKVDRFPDSLLIWPGHGAGSACGKSLGGVPVSSLGYERKTNWALQAQNEDSFVSEILSGQPEPPVYFKEMKRLNKEGPAILGHRGTPPRLLEPVGTLVDARKEDEILAGSVTGAIAIPQAKGFTNWAGWLLSYGQPVTLIANSAEDASSAAYHLSMIGLDVVSGWMPPSDFASKLTPIPLLEPERVRADDVLLDVRWESEWREGHLDAVHAPLGYFASHLDSIPRSRRIVAYCASGSRSIMACSLLRKAGLADVAVLEGGYEAGRRITVRK